MILFKHKTIYHKFIWGIPCIIFLQIAIACLFVLNGCQSTPQKEHRAEQVGGYTNQRKITDEELVLFKDVTVGTEYETYIPITVATQIVAGTNLQYKCDNGRVITVHKPLPHQGKPRIVEVK